MKKLLILFFTILGINLYSQNLDKDTIKVQEVEIVADLPYQATNKVPITFKNLNQKSITHLFYINNFNIIFRIFDRFVFV